MARRRARRADAQVTRNSRSPGIPSRARISPDGRWGGVTAFVVGHAYAAPGQFSTAATIVDLQDRQARRRPREGLHGHATAASVVDARDRNFWGLTFADDGDTFYATLATGGKDVADQGIDPARTRAHDPRERRVPVAVARRDADRLQEGGRRTTPPSWRFHVLDLATGKETPLAETRSIDDQLRVARRRPPALRRRGARPGSSTPTARAARASGSRPRTPPTVQGSRMAALRRMTRRRKGPALRTDRRKGGTAMCGIVGYVGQRSVQEILLAGLEKLEYRGYDSAGISIQTRGPPRRPCARSATSPQLKAAVAERDADGARRRARAAGHDRHRPHALGHARARDRGERAPALRPRQPRPRRGQRDRRELHGAQAGAPGRRRRTSAPRPTSR